MKLHEIKPWNIGETQELNSLKYPPPKQFLLIDLINVDDRFANTVACSKHDNSIVWFCKLLNVANFYQVKVDTIND